MVPERGDRLWLTSLPHEVATLFPPPPVGLRYEYSICNLESAGMGGISVTVVVRARGSDPAARFVINPVRFAEEIVTASGGGLTRVEGSKAQLRAGCDGLDNFRLEDVCFRSIRASQGCTASLRIRHWAPANGCVPPTAPEPVPEGPAARRCVECGRRGHRKQVCCDELGNCRVELIWTNAISIHRIADASTTPPAAKRARSCNECTRLIGDIREASRRLGAAQNAVRQMKAALAAIDGRKQDINIHDPNVSLLRAITDKELAAKNGRQRPIQSPASTRVSNATAAPANGAAPN